MQLLTEAYKQFTNTASKLFCGWVDGWIAQCMEGIMNIIIYIYISIKNAD